VMPDKHFQVVVRDRLGCSVSQPGALCQHRRADGSLCNAPLDCRGMHARICPIGGALIRKHNNLRDWAGKEQEARSGYRSEYEQRIPEWDATVTQEDGSETVEQAILDFVSRDAITGRQIHVDATVVCAFSTNEAQLRSRANKDGLAASQAANGKRTRYSLANGSLIPLAFEAGGRPSKETVEFFNSWQTASLGDVTATPMPTLWKQCSTLLQLGHAEQLLSALGCTSVPLANRAQAVQRVATNPTGPQVPVAGVAMLLDGVGQAVSGAPPTAPTLSTAHATIPADEMASLTLGSLATRSGLPELAQGSTSAAIVASAVVSDVVMASSTLGPLATRDVRSHFAAPTPYVSVTEWRNEPGQDAIMSPAAAAAGA
jgi:hypothetical protein